jgi:hypothetical protein
LKRRNKGIGPKYIFIKWIAQLEKENKYISVQGTHKKQSVEQGLL